MNHLHFDELDSTNKYIKEHIDELDNMSFVSASYQSAGKGRNERKWVSQKGLNLLFSFCIKEKTLIDKYNYVSLTAAYCVMRYLESIGIKNIKIKWPNDVYVADKKIAGILIEGRIPEFLVVGIGLNVNETDFAGEYRATPTSIKLQLGNDQNIELIRNELFKLIFEIFNNFENSFISYISYVQSKDYLLNKSGDIEICGILHKAKFLGINEDCSLKAEVDNKLVNIFSNEVKI